MALESYADLKSSIVDWMFDRPDLATFAGDFITLCEADLNRVVRGRKQITVASLTLDGDSKADLPDDYLEFRNVTALTNPRRRLSAVAPGTRDDVYPFRQAGYPSVFSIDGDTLMVLPKTTAEIELEYFAKIPALSDANSSNWLLDKFPNIYLYGSLKHACLFIGNNERAASFGSMFNGLLEALIREEKGAMWARGNARVAMVTP